MKKSIFKKIGGLFLGLAMAVGVGVAVSANQDAMPVHAALTASDISSTAATSVEDGAKYVIASGTSGNVYLAAKASNTWGTAVAIGSAYEFTAEGSGTSGFALKCKDGYLTPKTSSSNTFLAYGSTKVTCDLSSGAIVSNANTSYQLRQNGGSGYRWYSSATGDVAKLYKINDATPVTGVSVAPTSVTLGVGATQQLTPTVSPSNATNKNVSYSSSASSIASVSAEGLVTANAAGNATITVTTEDGNKTATCAVTVTAPKTPASLSSSGQTITFDAGDTFAYGGTLTATYTDSTSKTVSPKSFKIGNAGIDPTSAGTVITPGSTALSRDDHNGKTVYVLYTENNTTVYTSYVITVNKISKITLDPTVTSSFPYQGIELTLTGGTLTNGTDYRVYKNQTMTIKSTVGDMAKIEFTYDSASYDGGGWSSEYTPNAGTWTSSTANDEQARITKIIVTLASADPLVELNPKQILCQTGESSKTIIATTSNFSGTVSYDWSIKTGSDDGIISFTNSNTASLSVSILKKGNATLICTATSGNQTASAECQFTITQAVTSIQFVNSDTPITSLTTYDSFSYKDLPSIRILPTDANQNYTWNVTTGNDVINKRSETQYNILKTGTAIITAVSTGDTSKTCTLTITVENDTIDNIRVKSGSSPQTQYVGTTFNSTGLEFERHWYHANKWNVCDKSLLTFDDKTLTLKDTSVAVTYTGTTISINISITVLDTPATYTIKINSNTTTYTKADDLSTSNIKNYLKIEDLSGNDMKEMITFTNISYLSLGATSGGTPSCNDRISLGTDAGKTDKHAGELELNVKNNYFITNISLKAFNNASKDNLPTNVRINNNVHKAENKSTTYNFNEYLYTNNLRIVSDTRMWIYDIEITFEKASAAAETYAKRFNDANVCGTTDDTAANSTVWEKQAAYYTNADAAVQNAIKNGTAKQFGSTQLEQCLARYDRAVYRATLSDRNNASQINNFMGRAIASGSRINPIIALNEVDNSVWVISAVALVGLTAIGGYFFYRKRKEI